MAFKRSAVRFRLAPPNKLQRFPVFSNRPPPGGFCLFDPCRQTQEIARLFCRRSGAWHCGFLGQRYQGSSVRQLHHAIHGPGSLCRWLVGCARNTRARNDAAGAARPVRRTTGARRGPPSSFPGLASASTPRMDRITSDPTRTSFQLLRDRQCILGAPLLPGVEIASPVLQSDPRERVRTHENASALDPIGAATVAAGRRSRVQRDADRTSATRVRSWPCSPRT